MSESAKTVLLGVALVTGSCLGIVAVTNLLHFLQG